MTNADILTEKCHDFKVWFLLEKDQSISFLWEQISLVIMGKYNSI